MNIKHSIVLLLLSTVAHAEPETFVPNKVELCFTPGQQCEDKIITAILTAKKSIYVQAYGFTDRGIMQAISMAVVTNGAKASAILDRSNLKGHCDAVWVASSRTDTLIDSKHAIAHNKIVIIDEEIVITGSYNFTSASQHRNAENLLIINSAPMAERYLKNWRDHAAHSQPFDQANCNFTPTRRRSGASK